MPLDGFAVAMFDENEEILVMNCASENGRRFDDGKDDFFGKQMFVRVSTDAEKIGKQQHKSKNNQIAAHG